MNWKTIVKSMKNKDMQKRIFGVIGLLVIFRFLAHVPIPLASAGNLKEVVESAIKSTDLGGFINLLTGGALTSFSIMLVGLSPFITASIITQLMTKAIPSLEELNNDGESGRRKINQWTRILTVPLAIIQSIAYIFILQTSVLQSNSTSFSGMTLSNWIVAVAAMVTGSVLLMWIGEIITEKGVGNGISLVILATLISSITDTKDGALSVFGWFTLPVNRITFIVALILLVISIILLYVLVKINEAQRVITINYAKRVHGNSSYGGIKSILPVKLIVAGVIPVIFAVSFLSLPAFIGQVMKNAKVNISLADNLIKWFSAPNQGTFTGSSLESFIYPAVYFVLIVMFTYFYTSIVFNANEIADNLQKQGGFIEGVRPGISTAEYLKKVVNRLNLFGAIALGLIALLPFVADYLLYNLASIQNSNLSIGGTGILIIVTVALETIRQINSRALMVTYDNYK